jgi:hypothetical protein
MGIKMTAKVKKNEIIAIETQRTRIKMYCKTKRYVTYSLAQATRCNRQGVVERVRYEPNGQEFMLDRGERVLVISGPNQDLAALLWSSDQKEYSTAEELKSAILGVAATA